MTNLNVNGLSSKQYSLPPVYENRATVLIITGVRYTNPNSTNPSRVRMFYLANRSQIYAFRKQMLRRIFSKEPYLTLVKSLLEPEDPNSYLVPMFYYSSPNAINFWTTFRVRHERDFNVEGGKITFLRRREYYIEDLVRDLYEFSHTEPLPVEQLTEKYNEALNAKEEDD